MLAAPGVGSMNQPSAPAASRPYDSSAYIRGISTASRTHPSAAYTATVSPADDSDDDACGGSARSLPSAQICTGTPAGSATGITHRSSPIASVTGPGSASASAVSSIQSP